MLRPGITIFALFSALLWPCSLRASEATDDLIGINGAGSPPQASGSKLDKSASMAAEAGTMRPYLKNYYTEYELVLFCARLSNISAAGAENAKRAIGKIEAYYLRLDPSINKDSLVQEADKDALAAVAMLRQPKGNANQFCQDALKDLIDKMHQIEAARN